MKKLPLIFFLAILSGCAKEYLPPVNQAPIKEMFRPSSPEPPQAITTRSVPWTGWNRFWLASAIGGQAADAITTMNALDSGKCHESNPIFGQNPTGWLVVAAKLVAFGGVTWVAEKYYKGHPDQQKYRTWLYGTLAVAGGGMAVWNSQQDCD